MKFEKWQALGNDYIVLEEKNLSWQLSAVQIALICSAHYGCHSDGLLLLSESSQDGCEAKLRIFNPDGSEAELSGNGAREAILYLRRSGWTDKETFSIETAAGEIRPTLLSERECTVDMGRARLESAGYPSGGSDGSGTVEAAGRSWRFQHVSIGNPQCVIEVGEELDQIDLTAVGPEIENASIFPSRTNVSFMWRSSESEVTARIFERGVGETLSSGTGASGAAVAAVLKGASSPITVHLEGGDLTVDIGEDLGVTLTGWAVPVFSGAFSSDFIDQLKEISDQ